MKTIQPLFLFAAALWGPLGGSPAYAGAHTGRFPGGYLNSSSCTLCHPGKVDEVMGSIHFTWRTPNSKIAYPGGGSHGMIDRFCALVGSSAMVNFYADLTGHKGSSACGKCHVSEYLPFPDPSTGQFTQAQKDSIDCLICHAADGNYDMDADGVYEDFENASDRALQVDPDTGRRWWRQDRSLRAAESVGSPVSNGACLRCHEHGLNAADYKRGAPFAPEHDVHAAAGILCTDCHHVDHHKIARGSRVTDMHGWELPEVEVDCAQCHTSTPHPEGSNYNQHTAFIACETCHIPRTSGASQRSWYSTFGVTEGPEAVIPKLDPVSGVWEPYSTFTEAYHARPAYRWFNGGASMLAEPMDDPMSWNSQPATKATPNAKIYPFRPIINGMVMDLNGLEVFGRNQDSPILNPDYSPNFTMLAALDAMKDPLQMMGFMRPEGLTEAERAVLAQFPNLLNFDVEHYVKTGKVAEAVSIGLARLGIMMGGGNPFAPPTEELIAMGSQMWSGQPTGLNLPDNPRDPTYVPDTDPTTVTGSFISLSHGIKGGDQALHCADCHAVESVLDFNALSYDPGRADQLQRLLGMGDTDGDGLPDWFEETYFGSKTADSPASQPDADPDNDGMPNAAEMLARTNPGQAASVLRLLAYTPGVEGAILRWSSVPGRKYRIFRTADLGTPEWTTVGDEVSATGAVTSAPLPIPTEGAGFYRVEVTP